MIEMKLNETKWFSYRSYTPDSCDLLFTRAWLMARDVFYSAHCLDVRFDDDGNQYRLPLKWNGLGELKADKEIWKGIQKLRRLADRRCMPYPWLSRFAARCL